MVKQWTDGPHRPPVVLDANGYTWGPLSLTDRIVRPVSIVGVLDSLPDDILAELVPPEPPADDLFTALHRILGIDPTHPSMTHAAIRIDVTRDAAAIAIITVPIGDVEVHEVTNLFAAADWPWAGRTSRRLM